MKGVHDALLLIAIVLGAGLTFYACETNRANETAQVTLVRKFDTCFVIYKNDIEPIICPALEKP